VKDHGATNKVVVAIDKLPGNENSLNNSDTLDVSHTENQPSPGNRMESENMFTSLAHEDHNYAFTF